MKKLRNVTNKAIRQQNLTDAKVMSLLKFHLLESTDVT